jgi:putative ABC transport system permease protein
MISAGELTESVRIAVASLRSNLLRAVLTTGGVVVGVVLVVLMGWTINGLDAIWEKTISIIGKDMIYVDKWDWAGGRNWRKLEARKDITLDQANLLSNSLESAELAVPLVRQWGASLVRENLSIRGAVMGTVSAYGATPAATTEEGRFFTPIEDAEGSNVVVIGYAIARSFFPSGGSLGQIIKINGRPFRVIGVVEKRGFLFMDFIDQQVFIPLEAFRSSLGLTNVSFSVAIKAGNERMLDVVRDEAVGMMRNIRTVQPGKPDDFSVNEMKAFDAQAANIRTGIWIVGMGLTVLAFLVGSIGIMNIMFVSVTERTKEIGIRKAIGAKRTTILVQFLVESALLCLVGALIAFPFSQAIVASARWLAVDVFDFEAATAVSPFIPVNLLLLAVVVSVIVGLLAGLAPAWRASRLNPVEALRFE